MLSRWTVRGSYKSHSSPSASCPGLHDSPNRLSATTLLSFLSQSQGYCRRDTGLLPSKKAERVPRLKYFGQDTEKTSVVHKVSLVRVVGGAPAAGGVTFPSPSPSPAQGCSFGAWSRVRSVLEHALWESRLGGESLVVARGPAGDSPRPEQPGRGWTRLVTLTLFPLPGLSPGPFQLSFLPAPSATRCHGNWGPLPE